MGREKGRAAGGVAFRSGSSVTDATLSLVYLLEILLTGMYVGINAKFACTIHVIICHLWVPGVCVFLFL